MPTSTNPKSRACDDEIDLLPFIHALWHKKLVITAITAAGVIISLSLYAASPEQWTASTYLAKPSLLSLYNEATKNAIEPAEKNTLLESKFLNSIQRDIFYTAAGALAAKSITLKDVMPKSGKNEPVLYLASTTASSEELAKSQLNNALGEANSKALALNLPASGSESGLRAFNVVDDVQAINTKNSKKFIFLGAFLGFLFGASLVISRVLIGQYRSPAQS
ncbi:Wzz/FepE/Etk N-terminal domain-containing protein [Pseudomonas sp. SDO524_S393]